MAKLIKPIEHPAPPHLSATAAEFWRELCEQFIFEPADLARLKICCESLSTAEAAAAEIRRDGLTVAAGESVKAHPACAILRDARATALRALRELAIDVALPNESRLPRQQRRYS